MQLFSYFFGADAPIEIPLWSSLSRAEAESKVIDLLNSKTHEPLFAKCPNGNYLDQLHPISEETQIRLVREVAGWTIRPGAFHGEATIYPEKILLACLASPDAEVWIANPLILKKQSKQNAFIIATLAKFPDVVLASPGIWFRVNHEVFHSEAFALAIAQSGTESLFEQDEDGATFLFGRFLTEETVAHLFHALGRKDFDRLVTTRDKEGEHFAFSYTLNPETIMAVIDALPPESREPFVTASSKKGSLFTKSRNGSSKEVAAWMKENKVTAGRTTRSATRSAPQGSTLGYNTAAISPVTKEMWEERGSPKI